MANLDGYKQWLAQQLSHSDFTSNYWCAILAHEMEANKLSDDFKMPYFIVEEELSKEKDNFKRSNNEKVHYSTALKHWLVHLLKKYYAETELDNYAEMLRLFLAREGVLPERIGCPLTPSTSFHSLPTECKLWILYTLRNHEKPQLTPKTITKDNLGNVYFLVPDSRLYVRITRAETSTLQIDEERVKREPWGSLYNFVHSQPCLLLCENQEGWDRVWKQFQYFKLTNLRNAINPHITERLLGFNVKRMRQDEERKEFKQRLFKLASIANTNKQKKNSIKKEVEKKIEAAGITDYLQPTEVKGPITATPNANPRKTSNNKGRCRDFPGCTLPGCEFFHPTVRCNHFPNCKNGWKCTYLHDVCPNDNNCSVQDCAFEHIISKKTSYRMNPTVPVSKPTASVSPLMKESSEAKPQAPKSCLSRASSFTNLSMCSGRSRRKSVTFDISDDESTTPMARFMNELPSAVSNPAAPTKIKKRCQYFPQCDKNENCVYIHPDRECRNFPAGKPCPGQWCLFLHGQCPEDGTCLDLKCIYEHYKSKPIIVRKREMKKNLSQSRAPSVTNLSTYNEDEKPVKKESTNQAPADPAPPEVKKDPTVHPQSEAPPSPPTDARKWCRFLRSCAKKAGECEYRHPSEPCPKYPECPKGGLCVFLHAVCKDDGFCTKENCDCEHNLPHQISNRWCNNGTGCRRFGCKFIHPEECIDRCPTPANCWKYHRPTPPMNPTYPFPGPFPPPPFPPPGSFGPGYGPNFAHGPPGGPFGPMYGPGPGPAAGGWHHPGGNLPTGQPHGPNTRVPSPPPDYENLAETIRL